ncbi:MAG TPA: glycoside hydrolase family 3 N-terminal domain-containing protein, partial [Bacteroidales bacterium]|nr:glycoside hydrolase family 3 N-terminal domain-containing protein [Bacteroidales bacterium]
MKRLLILPVMAALLVSCAKKDKQEEQTDKLLSQLTLKEKISMIHGNTYFTTPPVERLGIPGFTLSDGPAGIREENNPSDWGSAKWKNDSTAYFPSLTALASTWNPVLATEFGKAYGEEAVIRNKFITLAPGINIHRTPLNGRNWEYLSEDPYLVTQFAPNIIKAVQKEGMASCVKHYILNNQEKDRNSINVEAGERALREIYYPGFEAAVKEGGALAVMGAYNKFRGDFCCENSYLLHDILKDEWGFKGVVISDWDAVHSTTGAAENGCDIEMGTNKPFDQYYMAQPLLDSIKAGKIDSSVVDDKVRRILYVMSELNMFNRPEYDTTGMAAKLATPERRRVSEKIAEEAIVLLKNQSNTLPLDLTHTKKIAVIGDNATRKHAHGGGSTIIKAKYEITPLEGIKNLVGDKAEIVYAPGYKYVKGKNNRYDPSLDQVDQKWLDEAKKAASGADVVLFIGGLNHDFGLDSEGGDKAGLGLPYKQDEVISEIMNVNPNTVVVLITGGPVVPGDWLSSAP